MRRTRRPWKTTRVRGCRRDAGDEESTATTRVRATRRRLAPGAEAGGERRGRRGRWSRGGDEARRSGRRGRAPPSPPPPPRRSRAARAGAFGEGPRPTRRAEVEGASAAAAEGTAYGEAGAQRRGGRAGSGRAAVGEDGAGAAVPAAAGEGQGPRRIMTPVDAALEILRGQAPGRGVHVRQIADGATRRRLVHGEPNEAWRVMRTALAAEPRERLRAGHAPARARRRARGSTRWRGVRPTRSWNAPSRCSARRGARCASGRWRRWSGASRSCRRRRSRRWRACCCSARGSARRRSSSASKGRSTSRRCAGAGSRPSRCLVGLQFGGGVGAAGAPSASCARASARAARTRAC